MKKLLILTVLIGTMGCTSLQSMSTSSIPPQRSEKVEAVRTKFIFLLLNFSNRYVDEMAEELANKCPDGRIQGILTKHENLVYFPLIAHGVRISAEGYCVTPAKGATNKRVGTKI